MIRVASVEDAPALAQLRWELRSAERAVHEDEQHFKERCVVWMRDRLPDRKTWNAWIAEADGDVAGCVWLQTVEKIPNPNAEAESFAYISGLYVRPEARGRLGTRLLRTCVEWAARHSIEHIVLWPTLRSRSLYRRFGFDAPRDLFLRGEPTNER